jgi:SAM-dependent methyltransferase
MSPDAGMSPDLRWTFTEDAELYQRARPGYPPELFAELSDLTGLTRLTGSLGISSGGRVLEIGPGTGQATVELARLATEVVAVELGPELAGVLRRRLAQAHLDDRVQVEVAAFEDWPLPGQSFDVVASFTAWHWLDPGIRTARAAAALAPGGSLATVTTFHARGGSVAFFDAAQDCYLRWDPATEPGMRLAEADSIPPARDEVDDSADFHPAIRRRFRQDVTYSTAAYLDVLQTYSGHRALPSDARTGLLTDLADLIDRRHGGSITKTYLYELRVAVRK